MKNNELFQLIAVPTPALKPFVDDDGDAVLWISARNIEIAKAYIDKRGWQLKNETALMPMDRVTDPDDPAVAMKDGVDVMLDERGEVVAIKDSLREKDCGKV